MSLKAKCASVQFKDEWSALPERFQIVDFKIFLNRHFSVPALPAPGHPRLPPVTQPGAWTRFSEVLHLSEWAVTCGWEMHLAAVVSSR